MGRADTVTGLEEDDKASQSAALAGVRTLGDGGVQAASADGREPLWRVVARGPFAQ